MLAEAIKTPEDYLGHSYEQLMKLDVFNTYPKISAYYYELCHQFKQIFNDEKLEPFIKWGRLLSVDAQIQILLELSEIVKEDWENEIGMSEEKIIQMIRHDKDTFYREITGGNSKETPKWGLIYLSEE